MRTSTADDPEVHAHRIPIIDKMMQVLEIVEQAGSPGASIGQIVLQSRLPRSTVYRILNTLVGHGMLARSGNSHLLGVRLLSLAAGVRTELSEAELTAIAEPHLLRLAHDSGETCKLSVLKDNKAQVISVVQSPNALAPSSRVGSAFELHAGAASKLLLAFARPEVQRKVLRGKLARFTDITLTDRATLEAELDAVRTSGISYDRGEWNPSVHAVAMPIRNFAGSVVAALSAAFFASTRGRETEARIAVLLGEASSRVSAALGHSG